MVTYGGSNAFQPATPQQKAEAQAKSDQIKQENTAVQEQRQQAPSAIKSGTPEDTMVRAEAIKEEQQRMVQEHVSQIGSSPDKFAQAREQALKSGSFSYGSGGGVPNSFVTSQGQRLERPVLPMTQGGNTKPEIIMRTAVTPPSPPSPQPSTDLFRMSATPTQSPIIQISQAQLNKTNQQRASQGLPPLEKVATVQVVAPTKGQESGTTTLFGKTFKTFTPTSEQQSGQVSSFLKVPFAGQKAQGGQVPSTSLADVFAFVPIGSLEKGAVSAGKELSSFFTKAFAKEAAPTAAKQASKVGSSDIGLNVPKYTQQFRTEKNIQSMISEKMKTPPPEMARQGREVTPTSDVTVKLGTGPGRVVSTGKGGTSILEGTGKPPTTPTEKTVSAGRGLEQIVREKAVSKTVQTQKPEFEQKQLSKQEEFLKQQEKQKQEQTGKTEQLEKQKQEESLIQRTGLRYIKEPKPTQKQTPTPLITIPKPRQTQKQKPQPLIPVYVPIQTPIVTPKQTQKQDQTNVGITDMLTVFKTPGTPSIPPPGTPPTPTRTPPKEGPPPEKKKNTDLGVLGVGGGGGLLNKVSKSGERIEFVGNVPTSSIVGTYKRSELSYSQRTIAKSESEQSKQATGRFVQRKSSRIL
jgi:hypothetical protein